MKKSKKQHQVPRCYLKRFTTNDSKLFAFDKLSNRSYPTCITDAVVEAYFYDFPEELVKDQGIEVQAVEKHLARIEAEYSPMLTDLIAAADSGVFSDELISDFSPYVALQLMRTKFYRGTIVEIYNKVSQDLADNLTQVNFPGESVKVKLKPEMIPIVHAQHFLDGKRISDVSKFLDDQIWFVGVNHGAHKFYTSDHPVVRQSHIEGSLGSGLLSPGVELAFPISNEHVVVILDRRYFKNSEHLDKCTVSLSDAQVEHFNRLQVLRCSQRVYCSRDDFQLARSTCDEHPEIRDPDRPRVKVDSTPIQDLRSYLQVTALD